jgi:outer membrane protein assembly factor BamB
MRDKKWRHRRRVSVQAVFLGSRLVMFTLGLTGCTGLGIHIGASPTPAAPYTLTHCNGQPVPTTRSAPPAAPPSVYAGSVGGFAGSPGAGADLYAYSAKDGTLRWCDSFATTAKPRCTTGRCPPPGVGLVGQPLLAANVVYVCVPNVLYALNASNGALRWTRETGCDFVADPFEDYGQPILANGLLYSGSYALNPANGSIRWQLPPQATPGASADGTLYAYSDEFLYALAAGTGKVRWEYVSDDVFGARPAVSGGDVYEATLEIGFSALAATTGKTLWSTYVSTFSGVAADSNTGLVYWGARIEASTRGTSEVLEAVAASTGKPRWQFQAGGQTIPSVPTVDQDTLYFSGDGVYAVNALDGTLGWHTPLGASLSQSFTPVTLRNGTVYVVGTDGEGKGTLYALAASTGSELWHTSGINHISPLVAG